MFIILKGKKYIKINFTGFFDLLIEEIKLPQKNFSLFFNAILKYNEKKYKDFENLLKDNCKIDDSCYNKISFLNNNLYY